MTGTTKMKALKDWSKDIDGLAGMDEPAVLNLYSEMLATAHDIGYTVPDALLIETEDASKLREVIPGLHAAITTYHAQAKDVAKEKAKAKDTAAKTAPAPIAKKKVKAATTKAAATEPAPKKPAKAAAQKGDKETAMATTAKKTAKKAPAKKTAKAAPAKKGAKKAAKANARTPVAGGARNPFGENAVIKVLNKDTGIKPDSERGKRVAVVFKYNGKKVADFYSKEQAPNNRTDTLRFLIDKGFISVK